MRARCVANRPAYWASAGHAACVAQGGKCPPQAELDATIELSPVLQAIARGKELDPAGPQVAKLLYLEAQCHEENLDDDKALEVYTQAVRKADGDLKDDMNFRIAEFAFAKADYARSAQAYAAVRPDWRSSQFAFYKLAWASLYLGDCAASARAVTNLHKASASGDPELGTWLGNDSDAAMAVAHCMAGTLGPAKTRVTLAGLRSVDGEVAAKVAQALASLKRAKHRR